MSRNDSIDSLMLSHLEFGEDALLVEDIAPGYDSYPSSFKTVFPFCWHLLYIMKIIFETTYCRAIQFLLLERSRATAYSAS
jgi:hypothetical protein